MRQPGGGVDLPVAVPGVVTPGGRARTRAGVAGSSGLQRPRPRPSPARPAPPDRPAGGGGLCRHGGVGALPALGAGWARRTHPGDGRRGGGRVEDGPGVDPSGRRVGAGLRLADLRATAGGVAGAVRGVDRPSPGPRHRRGSGPPGRGDRPGGGRSDPGRSRGVDHRPDPGPAAPPHPRGRPRRCRPAL